MLILEVYWLHLTVMLMFEHWYLEAYLPPHDNLLPVNFGFALEIVQLVVKVAEGNPILEWVMS